MKTKYKSDSKLLSLGRAFFVLAFALFFAPAFAGSLWREAVTDERGMFADKRARRVGDIITVVLFNERVKMDVVNMATRSDTNTSKPGLGTNLLNQFLAGITSRNRIPATESGSLGAYQSTFPSNLIPREPQAGAPPILNPGSFGFGNKNDNTVMFDRNINSQIAVQVIDVLPNGNLVVEGQRMVSFGPERMFASLRGIVRPYDVTAQNTIPSSLVADVRIDYTPEGPLSFTAKPGWLQRMDEKISPW
jgi:flagellar L-ring protein precursor FlgH